MSVFFTQLWSCPLLAQEEILEAIRRGLNAEQTIKPWLMLLLGAVGLLGLLLLARRYMNRDDQPKHEPARDYLSEAFAVLDLDHAQREDLRRLAIRARLSEPVAILLSPANLAHALDRVLDGQDDPALRQRYNALSIELFGKPLQKPARTSEN